MTKLFVFDMDGTLLRDTTACLEIAKVLNREEELHNIEHSFARQEINTRQFADLVYELWQIPEETVLLDAFDNASKIDNIKQVLEHIADHGHLSCLITMSPNYFADLFSSWGFDYVFASRIPKQDSAETEWRHILTPEDKVHLTREVCARHGIHMDNVFAFGDSSSDMHLFKEVSNTIAVNANEDLRAIALKQYSGNCLWEAYLLAHQ